MTTMKKNFIQIVCYEQNNILQHHSIDIMLDKRKCYFDQISAVLSIEMKKGISHMSIRNGSFYQTSISFILHECQSVEVRMFFLSRDCSIVNRGTEEYVQLY